MLTKKRQREETPVLQNTKPVAFINAGLYLLMLFLELPSENEQMVPSAHMCQTEH